MTCPCGNSDESSLLPLLVCHRCSQRYHQKCVPNLKNFASLLLGDPFFHFECNKCNEGHHFLVQKISTTIRERLQLVIFNLIQSNAGHKLTDGSMVFAKSVIYDALEKNWFYLTGHAGIAGERGSIMTTLSQQLTKRVEGLMSLPEHPLPMCVFDGNIKKGNVTRLAVFDVAEDGSIQNANTTAVEGAAGFGTDLYYELSGAAAAAAASGSGGGGGGSNSGGAGGAAGGTATSASGGGGKKRKLPGDAAASAAAGGVGGLESTPKVAKQKSKSNGAKARTAVPQQQQQQQPLAPPPPVPSSNASAADLLAYIQVLNSHYSQQIAELSQQENLESGAAAAAAAGTNKIDDLFLHATTTPAWKIIGDHPLTQAAALEEALRERDEAMQLAEMGRDLLEQSTRTILELKKRVAELTAMTTTTTTMTTQAAAAEDTI
ncbi:hypothetical protein BDR26DRAFT_863573 [Obelidium mucronatum]|nr:hypothetical protein BDR26DRAFT_863573 [Obelidium mucronatum]